MRRSGCWRGRTRWTRRAGGSCGGRWSGLPKGSRKTEFAAWVAVAETAGPVRFGALGREGPSGRASGSMTRSWSSAASTYEQADLLFGAARAVVTEGPLKEFFDAFDRELLLKGEPGKLVRVPAVAGANDGLQADVRARSMRRTSGPARSSVSRWCWRTG